VGRWGGAFLSSASTMRLGLGFPTGAAPGVTPRVTCHLPGLSFPLAAFHQQALDCPTHPEGGATAALSALFPQEPEKTICSFALDSFNQNRKKSSG
jgi:hypothetical protein